MFIERCRCKQRMTSLRDRHLGAQGAGFREVNTPLINLTGNLRRITDPFFYKHSTL
jgi:hypothetical protein